MAKIIGYLQIILIITQLHKSNSQNLPPESVAKITYFNNTEGLYYKFLGKMKVTNSEWKLIHFLDLEYYTTRYSTLSELYNTTTEMCRLIQQKAENPETTNNCQQFTHSTIPYFQEIDQNHKNILSTIGNNNQLKSRKRRGLRNAVSRLINVLYGSAENIDFTSIFNKIVQLTKNKLIDIDLIPEKTRIVKSVNSENQTISNQMSLNQQKIEQNIKLLSMQVKLNAQNIDKIKIRTTLLEQTLYFEILLNQYAYETQNLLAIVNSAIHGKVHTSVLHTQRWLAELREIRTNLPIGTILPLTITQESISEFVKISETTIFHRDQYLVFVVRIPLVQTVDFNAYKVIPLPIRYDNQSLLLIEPDIEIVALSSDTENFFSLTDKQWESCRELQSYTICKNSQPTHRKSITNPCEITLLSKPQNLPENCKIKLVSTNAPVWNRLPRSNSWLFYTKYETITIYCENPTKTYSVEISGVGRLTISTDCSIYTTKLLLKPSSYIIANTYADLIPENSKFNVKNTLSKLLDSFIPQNIVNVQVIKDLVKFSQNLQEIDTLKEKPSEPSMVVIINVHILVLYTSMICLFSLSIFIVLKFNKNNIKVYKPDLAEVESSENCETSGTIKPPCSI